MKLLKIFAASLIAVTFSFAAHAEDSSSSSSSSAGKVPVPTGKYITGGVLASTIGFGIGHGVQGRYGDKGWIFTTGEAAGLGMLLAANCKVEKNDSGDDETKCVNGKGLFAAGFGVILGFHIWEIVDAWTGATPVEDSGPKAFLIPDPKSPGIGIAFSF